MNWHKVAYNKVQGSKFNIDLPTSKSIANRLLILDFLSDGKIVIENLSQANDTVLLHKILKNYKLNDTIDCQDAGTALRFLTCLCASIPNKKFTLTGTQRLLNRPMQPLFDCLKELGTDVQFVTTDGVKKILIQGAQLKGKPLSISGSVSSQFISGLCLIASQIENGLELTIEEPILSKPYIDITLSLLSQMGVDSSMVGNCIRIPEQQISGKTITVEGDWSSACFFYSLMILSDDIETLHLAGLNAKDIQGDKYIAHLAKYFGIKTVFDDSGANLNKVKSAIPPNEIDLADYPDLAVPLIIASAFLYPDTKFVGLEHLKLKESNRILAIQENLEKFGILLKDKNGCISFKKIAKYQVEENVHISTHNDHRIAMSFSIVATLGYSIELDNIACIGKSFPDFFMQMNKVGISLIK